MTLSQYILTNIQWLHFGNFFTKRFANLQFHQKNTKEKVHKWVETFNVKEKRPLQYSKWIQESDTDTCESQIVLWIACLPRF